VGLKHPFTAFTHIFIDNNIYKLHGLPQVIVSDRDKVFTSALWKLLFKLVGTDLHLSSAYHPNLMGSPNVSIGAWRPSFAASSMLCPSGWSQWLSLVEYGYNTSSHSTLGGSPFEALYGLPPCHLGLDLALASPAPELQTWLEEHAVMHDLVHQHLLRAQSRMKRQADKGHSERHFAEGDKLQPYVQTSIACRSCEKLSFKFFGPYRVIARVGSVTYMLDLPVEANIHLVFHVSTITRTQSGIVSASVYICCFPGS